MSKSRQFWSQFFSGRRTLKIFMAVYKRDLSPTFWHSLVELNNRSEISGFSSQIIGEGPSIFSRMFAKLAYFATYREVYLSSARWPPFLKDGKEAAYSIEWIRRSYFSRLSIKVNDMPEDCRNPSYIVYNAVFWLSISCFVPKI